MIGDRAISQPVLRQPPTRLIFAKGQDGMRSGGPNDRTDGHGWRISAKPKTLPPDDPPRERLAGGDRGCAENRGVPLSASSQPFPPAPHGEAVASTPLLYSIRILNLFTHHLLSPAPSSPPTPSRSFPAACDVRRRLRHLRSGLARCATQSPPISGEANSGGPALTTRSHNDRQQQQASPTFLLPLTTSAAAPPLLHNIHPPLPHDCLRRNTRGGRGFFGRGNAGRCFPARLAHLQHDARFLSTPTPPTLARPHCLLQRSLIPTSRQEVCIDERFAHVNIGNVRIHCVCTRHLTPGRECGVTALASAPSPHHSHVSLASRCLCADGPPTVISNIATIAHHGPPTPGLR